MLLKIFINILFSIILINSKNIILPFKRVSFEKFIGEKTVNDYISYNIYTDIYMGTPPQKVTHFIEPHESLFQFKKQDLEYNIKKFNNSICKIEKKLFSLYNSDNSSSYHYKEYFSDNFLFESYDSNKKVEVKDLKFTIFLNNRKDKEKYGRIGLFTQANDNGNFLFNDMHSFIFQLKNKKIIDENVFSFIYDNNNNDIFDNNKKCEKIIIGESPHKYNKNININGEEKIYSNSPSSWSFLINEIKFTYNNESFKEEQIDVKFNFFSKFIKGSQLYLKKIEQYFFNELINLNECKKELISENRYSNQYDIIFCNNTKIIENKIKNFPNLHFIQRNRNLNFTLTYKDLFKSLNDKLYFMVIFPYNPYIIGSVNWEVGEIFLSKFIINFNLESKTISFYRNQFNEDNTYKDNKNNNNTVNYVNNEKNNSTLRNIIEIILGILIIIFIYLVYRKYRKSRKIHANELEDSNYAYVPNENNKENKLMKENELK